MVLERQTSAAEREMVKELARRRQRITFARDPIKVLSLFAWVCADAARSFVDWLVHHRRTGLYPLITLVAAYAIAAAVPGAHTPYLDEIRVDAEFVVWWFGLGVLSSIGLGTGMHSGLLFLFPHILKVCRSAEACGAVGFDTRANMWFAMGGDDLFACGSQSDAPAPATWLNVWLACLPAAVLWGGGTAAGEIPPYYISLLAARAGKENEELLELEEEETETMTTIQRQIHDWKVWMIDFMKTHGFLGLVAMSAWPNAAFDLCGICCGTFMMPFWQFFGATFVGKALIKAPAQAAVMSTVFSEGPRHAVVAAVAGAFPEGWGVRAFLHEGAAKAVHKVGSKGKAAKSAAKAVAKGGASGLSLSSAWGWMITVVVAYFAASCLEQMAQMKQARLDREHVGRVHGTRRSQRRSFGTPSKKFE